jgi:multiple sugar transport system permease protein
MTAGLHATERPAVAPTSAAPTRRGYLARRRWRTAVRYALTAAAALLFASPILYMFIGSLKPSDQVLGGLHGFLPSNLSLGNYSGVVDHFGSDATGHFGDFYTTSLIVSGVVVLGGLVVNSLAGYALARMRWRGRNLVLLIVIGLVILPFQAIAVPLYYMLDNRRDTLYVQFLPFVASAFSIYLFYSFFAGIPKEFEEAAGLDGAGRWRTFLFVIVPISKPVYASVAILSFLTSWSSYLWPVMMVDSPSVRPLPVEIGVFQGQQPVYWGQVFAFGVLMVAPVLVVFLLFQRWFVRGVVASGIKG